MKKETLEEAAENSFLTNKLENSTAVEKAHYIAGFKECAKWQINKQDEFTIEFGEWLMKKGRYNITNWSKTTKELLEIYKNTFPR